LFQIVRFEKTIPGSDSFTDSSMGGVVVVVAFKETLIVVFVITPNRQTFFFGVMTKTSVLSDKNYPKYYSLSPHYTMTQVITHFFAAVS
jgi:hypothetical protein